MNEKKSVALICYDNPFLKPREGGKIGIMSRINSLSMLDDCIVDVYLLNKKAEGMVQEFPDMPNIRKFYQYKMNGGIGTLFGRFPICTNKRYCTALIKQLEDKQYDFAIYEGLQVGKYRLKNKVNAKKHILYFHDIESNYRYELAKSQKNLVKKLANMMESKKFKTLEKQVAKYFDYFWFVSKEECDTFSKYMNITSEKALYIPFPMGKINDKIASGENRKQLLYVGDLSLENNISSLLWFVKNVFVELKKQFNDLQFVIIGKIKDETKQKFNFDGVEVLGYVPDIEKYYDESCFVASPVLFGAGVKVKIIDALSHGQIVVSTKKGIEGTELTESDLIFSDDADVLVKKCSAVISDRDSYKYISENALNFVKENHSNANQAKLINKTFLYLQSQKEK